MEISPGTPIEKKEPAPLKIKGDPGLFLFAARALIKYTYALDKEIEGVYSAEDIEFIHRMRVASRRVRTTLSVFDRCLPQKKGREWLAHIRKLTRALGQARDTDVQLALLSKILDQIQERKFKPGVSRLIIRLDQQRLRMQKKVDLALDELKKSKVIEEIQSRFLPYGEVSPGEGAASPALFELSYQNVNERLNEFLSFEVYLRQPEYKEELHAMRIAAKRLRYTMEIFAGLYNDNLKNPLRVIRKTQELLGDIHDCDVWIEFIPEFTRNEQNRIQKFYGNSRALSRLKPGLDYFLKNRIIERDRLFKAFLHEWSKWRKTETWLRLRETVLMAVPVEKETTDKDANKPLGNAKDTDAPIDQSQSQQG